MKRTVLILSALLLAPAASLAQSVHWNPPAALAAGQRARLDLVFEGTEPAGAVALPRVDGLAVLAAPGHQTVVEVVNGRAKTSVTLSYVVRPESAGAIEMPPFEVSTAAGPLRVEGITLDVGAAAAAARNPAGRQIAGAELSVSNPRPWAGEVFDIDLTVGLAGGRRGEIAAAPAWEKDGVIAEPWGEAERVEIPGGAGVRRRARAMAAAGGALELPPVRQEVRIESGRERANPFGSFRSDMLADFDRFFEDSPFDDFFARARMSEVTLESNALHLDVRPLPATAPPGFSGAVGRFRLESKIVPENAKTGEPVTWTLTVRGTGNWPAGVSLPARSVPASFRTLRPKQERHFESDDLFTGAVSEDVVLIPTRAGEVRLEPVRFVYFDPASGTYETAAIEAPVLSVSGDAVAATTADSAGERAAPPAPPEAGSETASSPTADPATTALSLRPRLAGTASALAPMPRSAWHLAVAAPLAALVLFGALLAARRAWEANPRRARRAQLRRLATAIERVRRADGADERRRALLAWQHAAVAVLGLDAAPTPSRLRRTAIDAAWIDLWEASDVALYAAAAELEPTWCARAEAARRALAPAHRRPARSRAGGLLGRTAAAGLVLLLAAEAPAADAPAGDSAAAGREAIAAGDWIARYNRGLARAGEGDDAGALAETAAAFVLRPGDESVRANLAALAARVPATDPLLLGFVDAGSGESAATGGGIQRAALRAAGRFSPAVWQWIAVLGSAAFAFGAALRLRRSDAGIRRGAAIASALAGIVVAAAGWIGVASYGPLADPHVAMIVETSPARSLPTEAQDAATAPALAAGAVVVVQPQTFLGWTKVALADGGAAWVRAEHLVPLYGVRESVADSEAAA